MDRVPADCIADFVAAAVELNEYVKPKRTVTGPPPDAGPPAAADGTRPGDDFNRRADWLADVVGPAGWRPFVGRYLTRPGKAFGVSASVGFCKSERGGDLLYVFTSSAPPLEPETAYTKFAAYAVLHHGGDFRAAAAALRDLGYGETAGTFTVQLPGAAQRVPDVPTPTCGEGTSSAGPAADRLFRWSSELEKQPQNDKWIWHGYLSRGGVTLLSALWKAGKTTLLAHLTRALAGEAGGTFCGQAVKPARVLYISEESEHLWADRRDELGLLDNVGWMCRPYRGRPNLAQWIDFLGKVQDQVVRFGFDLVVFDTLAKLWPVRDENDASGVDNALMPLWPLADKSSVLLVHHLRKSDGGEATGSRGSGALTAFVETIVELRRYEAGNRKDTKRVLSAYGRYRETPGELVVELRTDGYVALGETADARRSFRERLAEILPNIPPGVGWRVILAGLQGQPEGGVKTGVFRALLKEWVAEGWLSRRRDGHSHGYWMQSDGEAQVVDDGPDEEAD